MIGLLSRRRASARAALRRTRHIVRRARDQATFGRPGAEQHQGFRDAFWSRLYGLLQALDLPLAPALHCSKVDPPDPHQDLDHE